MTPVLCMIQFLVLLLCSYFRWDANANPQLRHKWKDRDCLQQREIFFLCRESCSISLNPTTDPISNPIVSDVSEFFSDINIIGFSFLLVLFIVLIGMLYKHQRILKKLKVSEALDLKQRYGYNNYANFDFQD